jgi:hypothetical protein
MDEQLDILGGSVPTGPPAVPPVVFHSRTFRRSIRGESATQCGHCVMNARRFYRGRDVGDWLDDMDVVILQAVLLITQPDGSTLTLCAQHAQEHEERGKRYV